jgi:hypothetical protein
MSENKLAVSESKDHDVEEGTAEKLNSLTSVSQALSSEDDRRILRKIDLW